MVQKDQKANQNSLTKMRLKENTFRHQKKIIPIFQKRYKKGRSFTKRLNKAIPNFSNRTKAPTLFFDIRKKKRKEKIQNHKQSASDTTNHQNPLTKFEYTD